MGRVSRIFVCALLSLVVGVTLTSVALAQGGNGPSAGDNQYIDPLTTTTPTSPAPSSSSPPSSSSSSGSSGSSSSSSGAPSSPAPAPSSPSTASSPPADSSASSAPVTTSTSGAGDSLPFTGLNVGACVALGVGLLGGGLLLRRIARRA